MVLHTLDKQFSLLIYKVINRLKAFYSPKPVDNSWRKDYKVKPPVYPDKRLSFNSTISRIHQKVKKMNEIDYSLDD